MAGDAFSIKFDSSGLDAGLAQLQTEAESVRPAAQAGAQILYNEVLLRVPVGKRARKTKSGREILPGALKASIYQVFSADNSPKGTATYHVSWNARKAPHGHLVEFGTSRAPAHPFIRPAYDAKVVQALQAVEARWSEDVRKAITRLT